MQDPGSKLSAPERTGQFNTTHWSVVLLAGQEQSPQSAAALEKLCRAYWHPIYVFARRKGCAEEDAKDLTQHFFYNLLERGDFSGLDPRKGKFRTFMLTAFSHFLANEHDRTTAQKRGGGRITLSIDEFSAEELCLPTSAPEQSAAMLFDARWARSVIAQALDLLKGEMTSTGKSLQFDALKVFLTSEPAEGEYAAVARKLGAADSSVGVLVHRLRQRYRQLVREQVAQTVTSPAELEEEMRHLFEVLNR